MSTAAEDETTDGTPDGTTAGNPFARVLQTIGKGPGRGRPLTREEARDAFASLLDGRAAEIQVGAFLLLMRYRGETPEELAGFIEAARTHEGWPALGSGVAVDLD